MDGSKEIPIIEVIKKYWEEKLKKDEKDRPPGLENSYYAEFVMQQFIFN